MAGIAMETGTFVTIGVSQMESPAVRIAAQNLKQDLMSVLAAEVSLEENKGNETIIVGTIGVSQGIEQYFDPGNCRMSWEISERRHIFMQYRMESW